MKNSKTWDEGMRVTLPGQHRGVRGVNGNLEKQCIMEALTAELQTLFINSSS